MRKTCVYCGKHLTNDSKSFEHVIPRWLLKRLNAKKHSLPSRTVWADRRVTGTRHPNADTLGRKICKACNNEWLGQIDSSCMDAINELANQGAAYPDDVDSQWAEQYEKVPVFLYKIALNYLTTTPFAPKLTCYFEDFYETKKPRCNSIFFISRVNFPSKLTINHSGNVIFDEIYDPAELSSLPKDITTNCELSLLEKFSKAAENVGAQQPVPFKIFLQLGHAAFVIVNRGSFSGPIIYDKHLFTPMFSYSDTCAIASTVPIALKAPPQPCADTISARVLNSLKLSFKQNEFLFKGVQTMNLGTG